MSAAGQRARPGGSGAAKGRLAAAPPPPGTPSLPGRTPRLRRPPSDTESQSVRKSRNDGTNKPVKESKDQEMSSTRPPRADRQDSRLLQVKEEVSSDSSSGESPRSVAGAVCGHRDGRVSSEDSIAVDCSTSPTEVIVQGKNVKQIRVKFPPHPPGPKREESPRPGSCKTHETRPSSEPICSSEQHQAHPKSEDGIPLSQEESSSPSDSSTWSIPPLGSLSNSQLVSDSGVPSQMSRDSSLPNLSCLNLGGLDMDVKFKQDILHGLEYFDRKNDELKNVNKRIMKDLERMAEVNRHLEDHIEQLNKRFSTLNEENEELKIKMDQLGKENMQLQEQAMSEWTSRVKAEEMYLEVKRDTEDQIKGLKDLLDKQNKELKNLRKQEAPSQEKGRNRDSNVAADALEHARKVSQLQDEINKLNTEKELDKEANSRLQDELRDLRDLHKQKTSELEAQYKRFLSLKKSFNDLLEEHEGMKKQVRSHKEGMGSSTWPSNKCNTLQSHAVETVRYIDLPSAKGHQLKVTAGAPYKNTPFQSTSLLKAPTVAIRGKMTGHSRARSEGLCLPDNLPPVSSPAK